jgi:hypothetical protein
MMYASKEEEKGRMRKGRGKEKEEENSWAYGKKWPFKVTLGPTMSYPCTTCGQPPREGKVAKGKRKGRRGGESMGVWRGAAMDSLKYQ